MRYSILFFLILIGFLSACTKDNDPTPETEGEQWQLVKMWGQIPNSETTGEDMEWQESYFLLDNGEFLKSRTQNGVEKEARGKASFEELSDGMYLVLEYEENNDLIGNCFGDLREELFLESEDKLISTWQACDGPGLEYEKVE